MTVRGITPQALADLFRARMRIAPASVSLVTARGAESVPEGSSRLSLGSFADPDGGPWSVDVVWGDGTPHSAAA